ncbi:mesogenin-1 [Polypterus senegalus]
MDNLHGEPLPQVDDLNSLTSKLLAEWGWKAEEVKDFERDQEVPANALSPASSFESFCPSPPRFGDSEQKVSLVNIAPHSLGSCGRSLAPTTANHRAVKPKMSIKRRMKASEREKLRMRSLADALHQLRDYLPADYSQRGQPLTKIQTLKYTIQYINELSELLRNK